MKIIKFFKYLSDKNSEFILSKRILRSGTSIAANVREALEGQSRRDFISKISIDLKEAAETEYWVELFLEADLVKKEEVEEILMEIREIIKILNTIICSTKKNLSIKTP